MRVFIYLFIYLLHSLKFVPWLKALLTSSSISAIFFPEALGTSQGSTETQMEPIYTHSAHRSEHLSAVRYVVAPSDTAREEASPCLHKVSRSVEGDRQKVNKHTN